MSEAAFGGGNHTGRARIEFDRRTHGAGKGLENRLALVVRVHALEVVDVQRAQGVVHKALEELINQLRVERTQRAGGEVHVHVQNRLHGNTWFR